MDDEARKASQYLRRLAEQVEGGDVESVICVVSEDFTKDPDVYVDGTHVPVSDLHNKFVATREEFSERLYTEAAVVRMQWQAVAIGFLIPVGLFLMIKLVSQWA